MPRLRADADGLVASQPLSGADRRGYAERVCAGGFPLALRRSGPSRNRWFDDYLRQTLERDALELRPVRQRQALRDLLNRLAARTAQVLNLSQATQGLVLSRDTVDGYTRLLADLFVLERLPGWGKTLRSRSAAAPKVYLIDSGVVARLLRVSPDKLGLLDPTTATEFGHLLETFVVGELRKQLSWLDEPVTMGHWRTKDGDEVDLVIEFDDGGVLAFEVKAGEHIRGEDLRGARKLRDLLGPRLLAGVALSTGRRSYSYQGERIHVMPVDRLWSPTP